MHTPQRVALAALVVAACADPTLEVRVAQLEQEVAALKAERAATPAATPAAPSPAPARAAPPAPAPADDDKAAAIALFREANSLAAAGRIDEARSKIEESRTKYPTQPATKNAIQLGRELEIIGRPAGALDVDRWYQGSGDLSSGTTLLVFWEVWCPHCKREVPKLQATHDALAGRGLRVVGLTKQTRNITDAQVEKFIADNGITYPIAREQGSALSQRFAISGIPAAAVVKDGEIVWRGHPARLSPPELEKWL